MVCRGDTPLFPSCKQRQCWHTVTDLFPFLLRWVSQLRKFRIFVSDIQSRCSSNQCADSKGSLGELDDLEILTSQITKVVHYYSSDGLGVESEDGWKDKMMKKGREDEWIATVEEGGVHNLSLALSLMDGWKEEVRGLMMKTGELWVSHCPRVSCRSAEKGLIEWLKSLFGLPLSSPLPRPDGVVNNPLKVLHNLSLVVIGRRVIFKKRLTLSYLCLSSWSVWFILSLLLLLPPSYSTNTCLLSVSLSPQNNFLPPALPE